MARNSRALPAAPAEEDALSEPTCGTSGDYRCGMLAAGFVHVDTVLRHRCWAIPGREPPGHPGIPAPGAWSAAAVQAPPRCCSTSRAGRGSAPALPAAHRTRTAGLAAPRSEERRVGQE